MNLINENSLGQGKDTNYNWFAFLLDSQLGAADMWIYLNLTMPYGKDFLSPFVLFY